MNLLWVMPAKGDVMRIVIIGAGVLGASTAFHLARAGGRRQCHRRTAGRAGDGGGRRDHLPVGLGVEDPVFYRLYAAGGEYYPDLIAALAEAGETDLGYRRAGRCWCPATGRSWRGWNDRFGNARSTAMGGEAAVAGGSAGAVSAAAAGSRRGACGRRGRVDGRRLAAALLRAAGIWGDGAWRGHATWRWKPAGSSASDWAASGSRLTG